MARSDVSLLNFVVSDGRSLIATRYVSNTDESPASLYYAEVCVVGRICAWQLREECEGMLREHGHAAHWQC